jgi:hypothetical protein
VRQKLKSLKDGDRQMVAILTAVLDDGLPAVEAACAEALHAGLCSSDCHRRVNSLQIGRLKIEHFDAL